MLVIGVDTSSLMEVALRKSPNGKGMPLWKHEFYGVYKTKTKTKNKRHVDIYQVLEFRIGEICLLNVGKVSLMLNVMKFG